MCVRGSPHVMNKSSEFLQVHLSHHDGWGYFFVSPDSKREGPEVKFTDEPWFPGREFDVPCAVTKPDGSIVWKGKLQFKNFHILANAFIEVAPDPSGQLAAKPASFADIQAKISEHFFDHDGPAHYPTGLSEDFDHRKSDHLESA